MSSIANYIISQGAPEETIILLLMLPITASVIAFARQIVGIKGFGIYTPLIIAYAFIALGLIYGLAFFLIIMIVGTLMRFLVKKSRLLYLPRMALVITSVAIAIFLLILTGAYFKLDNLIMVPIFAVIVMITLVEKFIAAQIERGNREAIILTLETLALSIICYWIALWPLLQSLVLTYPALVILATVLINLILGKWTGLRLAEVYRFRQIIKNIKLPQEKISRKK